MYLVYYLDHMLFFLSHHPVSPLEATDHDDYYVCRVFTDDVSLEYFTVHFIEWGPYCMYSVYTSLPAHLHTFIVE